MNKTAITRRGFIRASGIVGAGALMQMRSSSADGNVSIKPHYDLVVIGAGSAGFGAALSAARSGLSVLLVEKEGRIGGSAVVSGVSMWESGVGGTGYPFEIYSRLKAIPNAAAIYSFGRHISWSELASWPGSEQLPDSSHGYVDTLQRHCPPPSLINNDFRKERWHGVIFEPDPYEKILLGMLEETGRCKVLRGATFTGVEFNNNRLISLKLSNGSIVCADAFADATGDGVLCAACGCEIMIGQEAKSRFGEPSAPETANRKINGVTLIFRIAHSDKEEIEPLPENIPESCWWGEFGLMSAVKYPCGDYNCNMLPTMQGADFLEMGYAKARVECERRVAAFWRYVQTQWPELRSYRRVWTAPALGIRETSRVVTEYILTENDLLNGLEKQSHSDIITIADHSMDRHGKDCGAKEIVCPYGVPYRCMIPKGCRNLIVAGRAAGFSSLAASSCRLSRTMMQLGQAAGTAVALASELSVELPNAPSDKLRERLSAQGCQLEFPISESIMKRLTA